MAINTKDITLNSIKDDLETIFNLSKNPDLLYRERELGTSLSFIDGEKTFTSIFNLANPLKNKDLSEIPIHALNKLKEALSACKNDFERVQNFKPERNNLSSKDGIMNNLESRIFQLFEAIQPIATYLIFYSSDVKGKESELLKIQKKAAEMAKQIEIDKGELSQILEASRKAAGAVGVSSYASIFGLEAENHRRISNKWLWWVIILLGVIAGVGFSVLYFDVNGYDSAKNIQIGITKVLVITVLFYGLNLCSKNYKANLHNALINKHRQNSLNTFEAFVKSAGDDIQTKNAILLEATRTIFNGQQTGYVSGENENEFPSRIIEIIKSNKAS